jgi:hypothetical protein
MSTHLHARAFINNPLSPERKSLHLVERDARMIPHYISET